MSAPPFTFWQQFVYSSFTHASVLTYKERQSLKRLAKMRYDKEHTDSLSEVRRIKGAYAEPFTKRREDNAETVESRDTVFAIRV